MKSVASSVSWHPCEHRDVHVECLRRQDVVKGGNHMTYQSEMVILLRALVGSLVEKVEQRAKAE